MHEQQHETAADEEARRRAALASAVAERTPVINGPHVWIGSVESYEAGQPQGAWVTLNQSRSDVEWAVRQVARGSADGDEANTWGVYAAMGFGAYQPSVDSTVGELVRCARLVRDEIRAFHAWARAGVDNPAWLLSFHDHYLGCYDCFDDWLNLEIERAGWDRLIDRVLPAELRPHVEINLESLGHDLLTSGAVLSVEDQQGRGVFVFRGRRA